MKYLFVVCFISVYILFGIEMGYSASAPLHTHLTYMFQHASIIHLALNSMGFIAMFHTLQKFINKWLIIPSILLCGFAASFLSVKELPTVGASSMIYAMLGMYIGQTSLCRKIKIANTRRYLLFMSIVALGLLLSMLNPGSNVLVHIYSLLIGFVISIPIALRKSP